jgi:hypothetical protein
MKKFKIVIYTAVPIIFLLAGIFVAFSQEDMETVSDSAFTKQTRPAVVFFHDAHNEMAAIEECNVCHHMFKDGKLSDDDDSIGMECSECHYNEPESSIPDLIRMYHLQCGGCHLKQKIGPVMCGECHRK